MPAALTTPTPAANARAAFGRFMLRVALQSAALAGIWLAADFVARKLALPVPGSVVGLIALLALLFCGGVTRRAG